MRSTSGLTKSLKTKIKIGLSIFIIYHLYIIILIPNAQTYLGQRSAPWVEAYVNFFELSTNWGFFAPETGPPPLYLEWDLEDQEGRAIESGRWPTYPDSFFFRERLNRRIAAVRFMALTDERAEKMMVPYLCGQNPKVAGVQLWKVYYELVPLLEAARFDGSQTQRKFESNPVRHIISHSFCKEYSS